MFSIKERPFSFCSFSPVATGYIGVGERVKHPVRTTRTWERIPSLLSRMKRCQNPDFTLCIMCRYGVILYDSFESRKQKVGQCHLPRPSFFLLLWIFLGNFSRNNGAAEWLCHLQSAGHAGPGLLCSSLPPCSYIKRAWRMPGSCVKLRMALRLPKSS